MWANDGQASFICEFRGKTNMIDVPVGQQYFFQLNTRLRNRIQDFIKIATRIDNGGRIGRCAPQQGAVLCVGVAQSCLEGSNGQW